MKAAGQDEDGSDLLFTLGTHQLKSEKRASAFKEAMRHSRARPKKYDVMDIKKPLGQISERYLQALGRAKMAPWSNKVKELTIIILIDGFWEGIKQKGVVDEQTV